MMDLRSDVVYSVCRSSNMIDWVVADEVNSVFNWHVLTVASNQDAQATAFYCARVDRGIPTEVRANEPMIVTIETTPIGGATEANIVYSTDDGATWTNQPMHHLGTKGVNDIWNAHLGTHPSGTVIQYAIEVQDDTAVSFWDNNSAQDYQTTVVP